MASITVRNLPDETHRALRARVAAHSRSTEAEVQAILESAVRPEKRVKLGRCWLKSVAKWEVWTWRSNATGQTARRWICNGPGVYQRRLRALAGIGHAECVGLVRCTGH